MRPRHARGSRVWRYVVAGLFAAFVLSQWFAGVYVTPPRAGDAGRTDVVWRADGEPFFNSPAVPGFEGGPAGRVLVPGLPFWSYAYRQSLRAAARAETLTVGAARAPSPEAGPVEAEAPPPAAPKATPSAAARPPVPIARPPASPSVPVGVAVERNRRLDRIRREMERIRRESTQPSSAGARPAESGG